MPIVPSHTVANPPFPGAHQGLRCLQRGGRSVLYKEDTWR